MNAVDLDFPGRCADLIWNVGHGNADLPPRRPARSALDTALAAPAVDLPTEPAGATKRVLLVHGHEGAAYALAARLRQAQPGLITMCAHTAHAALIFVSETRPDAIVIDFGSQATSGEVIAGAIFVACPAAKPLMVALSGAESRKRNIESTQLFDHIVRKPFKAATLADLIANKAA